MKKNFKMFCMILTVFALSFMPCGTAFADEELANSMTSGTWTANPRYITFGEYNGHTLKWRLLEVDGDKTAFLVLDDVLREEDGGALEMFFDDGSNSFPASEIFTFLNDTFLSNLADYQGGILTATYGPDADGETWDGGQSEASSQVFLLSAEDARNPDYFKDYAARDTGADYWLRSPHFDDILAAFVRSGGGFYNEGNSVGHYQLAVRPALKIDLSSPVFTSALVSYPVPEPQDSGGDDGGANANVTELWLEIPDFPKDAAGKIDISNTGQVIYTRTLEDGAFSLEITRISNPDNMITTELAGMFISGSSGVSKDDLEIHVPGPDEEPIFPLAGEYPFAWAEYESEDYDGVTKQNVDYCFFPDGYFFWVRVKAIDKEVMEKYDLESWFRSARIIEGSPVGEQTGGGEDLKGSELE